MLLAREPGPQAKRTQRTRTDALRLAVLRSRRELRSGTRTTRCPDVLTFSLSDFLNAGDLATSFRVISCSLIPIVLLVLGILIQLVFLQKLPRTLIDR